MDSAAVSPDEPDEPLEPVRYGPLPAGSGNRVWGSREVDQAKSKALASLAA